MEGSFGALPPFKGFQGYSTTARLSHLDRRCRTLPYIRNSCKKIVPEALSFSTSYRAAVIDMYPMCDVTEYRKGKNADHIITNVIPFHCDSVLPMLKKLDREAQTE
jgi:hypothetical protein